MPGDTNSIRLDLLTLDEFQDIYEKNMNTTMYSCTTDLALLKKDYDNMLYRMIVVEFHKGIGVYSKGNLVIQPGDS